MLKIPTLQELGTSKPRKHHFKQNTSRAIQLRKTSWTFTDVWFFAKLLQTYIPSTVHHSLEFKVLHENVTHEFQFLHKTMKMIQSNLDFHASRQLTFPKIFVAYFTGRCFKSWFISVFYQLWFTGATRYWCHHNQPMSLFCFL